MTDAQLTTIDRTPQAPADVLRWVVRADAAVTGMAGVALLGAARPLADEMGLATSGPVLAVGAFFVVLAGIVALLGLASDALLLRLTPINAGGDLAWAGASVIVAAVADLSSTGVVLLLAQALVVLAVGAAKLVCTRRARTAAKIPA